MPHSGFAVAMWVIGALMSALMTGGRPPVALTESRVQYSQKPRRCHRRTVSGVTMTRDCRQPAQILARLTQNSLAVARSLGRDVVRLLAQRNSELLAQGQGLQGQLAVGAPRDGDEPQQAVAALEDFDLLGRFAAFERSIGRGLRREPAAVPTVKPAS